MEQESLINSYKETLFSVYTISKEIEEKENASLPEYENLKKDLFASLILLGAKPNSATNTDYRFKINETWIKEKKAAVDEVIQAKNKKASQVADSQEQLAAENAQPEVIELLPPDPTIADAWKDKKAESKEVQENAAEPKQNKAIIADESSSKTANIYYGTFQRNPERSNYKPYENFTYAKVQIPIMDADGADGVIDLTIYPLALYDNKMPIPMLAFFQYRNMFRILCKDDASKSGLTFVCEDTNFSIFGWWGTNGKFSVNVGTTDIKPKIQIKDVKYDFVQGTGFSGSFGKKIKIKSQIYDIFPLAYENSDTSGTVKIVALAKDADGIHQSFYLSKESEESGDIVEIPCPGAILSLYGFWDAKGFCVEMAK